jgi:hypothetical protein
MSKKQMQAWDPDKPCAFRVWHKRLGKRAKVVGYSLRQFCEEQKWDWNDIVGVWISNQIDPFGITWYETDAAGSNLGEGRFPIQKGE